MWVVLSEHGIHATLIYILVRKGLYVTAPKMLVCGAHLRLPD